ncbi:MAG TPA: fused MFS/spermidine synthase [Pirellulales bacterium]|nr:fused MFS/spermidine synthase [Pirellulales bacterium]
MAKSAKTGQVSRRLFWLASGMFFLSGGTGLAYQVIWFKRFTHVWGSSSLAFAAVGGSFLFGLGVGAYLSGRLADRLVRPLGWYGVCESFIGLAALSIPLQIQALIGLSSAIYAHLPQEPLVRFLLQFLVTLVIIGPPCALMGATLPLLTRELTARDGALDEATGWLYAINTYGAAAGCYLTGFHVLPALGLVTANNSTALLNIAIGVAAIVVQERVGVRSPRLESTDDKAKSQAISSAAPKARSGPAVSLASVYVAVTLAGLAALILEMTWSRQLALVLGGSTYAYSATLFVVLLGIATGSLFFHLRLRSTDVVPYLPMIVIFGLGVTCFAGKLLLPWLSTFVGDHRTVRQTLLGNASLCVMAAAVVQFLPAVAMGVLFPVFVDLTHEQAARVGRAVGDVYAWNTFGSIVGASLTAVVLFPRFGTAGAMGLAMGLYLLAMLLVTPSGSARELRNALGCALALAAIIFGVSLPLDPRLTNLGLYLYGSQAGVMDIISCKYFAEGPTSSVAVISYGDYASLRVNGKVDAGDLSDMVTQLGLAYFPRIFCPAARDVLVIGFGSGTTSGTSLLLPGTRVTSCEIEPAVVGAEPFFQHINHRPLERTRASLERQNEALPPDCRRSAEQLDAESTLRMVYGDGRSQLQGDEQSYDIIISEPSNPWLAGVSNLFTEEFFTTAQSRLRPGGVLAQWVQTYNISLSDYLMIVRTMRKVFPYCGLVTLTGGLDTVLLASDRPLLPDAERLEAMQKLVDSSPDIEHDWRRWFHTTDVRTLLLARYTIDQEILDELTAKDSQQRTNTDRNMLLEFKAPLHLFASLPEAMRAGLRLAKLPHGRWTAQLGELIGAPPGSALFLVAQAIEQMDGERWDQAATILQQAIAIEPHSEQPHRLLADVYLKQGKSAEAVKLLEDWLRNRPDRSDARMALFNIYRSLGMPREAAAVFQPVVDEQPENAFFHMALGQVLLELGRRPEAAREFRQALARDPALADAAANRDWINAYVRILATSYDPSVRDGQEALRWARQIARGVDYDQWGLVDSLAAAFAETGQFDAAVAEMREVLKRATVDGNQQATQIARDRLALYEAGKPLREQPEPAAFTPPAPLQAPQR